MVSEERRTMITIDPIDNLKVEYSSPTESCFLVNIISISTIFNVRLAQDKLNFNPYTYGLYEYQLRTFVINLPEL